MIGICTFLNQIVENLFSYVLVLGLEVSSRQKCNGQGSSPRTVDRQSVSWAKIIFLKKLPIYFSVKSRRP